MRGSRNTEFKFIDIHCHVLPGIDDGSKSMEMTMTMLANAEQQGFSAIIATPHYKQNEIHISPEKISARIAEVQKAARQEGLQVKLFRGNELYYHHEIEELLEKGEIYTMADTACVLVEFAPTEQYVYIRNAVDSLGSMGYYPIIAHAERYLCLERDINRMEELKSMGAFIQLNAGSITGMMGMNIQRICKSVLKRGLADFIATDAHRDSGNRDNSIAKCAQIVYKKYGKEYADKLFWKNAGEILYVEA